MATDPKTLAANVSSAQTAYDAAYKAAREANKALRNAEKARNAAILAAYNAGVAAETKPAK